MSVSVCVLSASTSSAAATSPCRFEGPTTRGTSESGRLHSFAARRTQSRAPNHSALSPALTSDLTQKLTRTKWGEGRGYHTKDLMAS